MSTSIRKSFVNKSIILAILVICTLSVIANVAFGEVKLQTNPKLLVAYPYFSVKFVPANLAIRNQTNKLSVIDNNHHALATPATDSTPFSLTEVAFYEVVTGGHGFATLHKNLNRLKV